MSPRYITSPARSLVPRLNLFKLILVFPSGFNSEFTRPLSTNFCNISILKLATRTGIVRISAIAGGTASCPSFKVGSGPMTVRPVWLHLFVDTQGFPLGLDCILSQFKVVNLSLLADDRAVVDGESCTNQNVFRFFTRGLPNPKRYYDALGHYPGY